MKTAILIRIAPAVTDTATDTGPSRNGRRWSFKSTVARMIAGEEIVLSTCSIDTDSTCRPSVIIAD
jgi:hypothetical protein